MFTWGDTPEKTISADEGVSIVEESKIETSQDLIQTEKLPGKKRKRFIPFDDTECIMRRAYPKYESWKNIENLALTCNKNENLRCYVLCAGIMYGLGEIILSQHFMSAWLGEIEALPFIAPGDNVIPTVHITDLARMVAYILAYPPNQRYIVGCDHSADTQLMIIQAISSAMSDGKVKAVDFVDVMLENWSEYLSLHLLVNTSSIFDDPAHPMEWHCSKGIVSCIDLLNQEFNAFRALRSVKVFVTGPPVSGKSHYSRKLAERYSVPHLHISSLIHEILQSTSELGEKVRKKLADLKQHMIEEAESKKKKNQELDYSKFNPRVPEDLVSEIVKWKLNSNICRNRGYILEGWPRKFEDAKRLFTKEDESLDKDIYPDSVIIIKATNEFLIARAKSMPEQMVVGTHYNDEGMKRRLQAFRDANIPDKQPLIEYFISHKSETLEIEASVEEMVSLENIEKFIERNGKPFKFTPDEEEKGQETLMQLESVRNLKEEESKRAEQVNNVEYLIMMEQMRARENNLLELRSQPVRNYLMEKVAPAITEGLFKLCKDQPQDPVLFLAKFLKSKSITK